MKLLNSRAGFGLAGLLAGASLAALSPMSASYADKAGPAPSPIAGPAIADGRQTSLADLVERVSPSVVQIIVRQSSAVQRLSGPEQFENLPPEFRDFFGRGFGFRWGDELPWQGRELPDRVGSGSGFFIEGGYIVTNNHVVDHAKTLKVRLEDGTEVDASVVGTDDKTDLAVVKVDGKHARTPLKWGDSDRSRVGDNVFTIGAPFSLGNTVTAGVISARGRDINSGPYDDYFQIDAPINPGNSGGPMFNASGEVIGVNTAIYSPSGGNVGIGFSIPSDQAQAVVRELIDHGHVQRGWLGVNIQRVTPEIASSLNLERARGALVADVTPDSPAARAGLQSQDVVLAFGDRSITNMHDLTRAVADTKPGESRPLKILRSGREQTITVRIAALESESKNRELSTERPSASSGKLSLEGLGLVLSDDGGKTVIAQVDVNSIAEDAGLREGDRLLSINGTTIVSIADAERSIAQARSGDRKTALVRVERNGARLFIGLPLDKR